MTLAEVIILVLLFTFFIACLFSSVFQYISEPNNVMSKHIPNKLASELHEYYFIFSSYFLHSDSIVLSRVRLRVARDQSKSILVPVFHFERGHFKAK